MKKLFYNLNKLSKEEQVKYIKIITIEQLYDFDFGVQDFKKFNNQIQTLLTKRYCQIFISNDKLLKDILKRIKKYNTYNILQIIFENLTIEQLLYFQKYKYYEIFNTFNCFHLYIIELLNVFNDNQHLICWFEKNFLNQKTYTKLFMTCFLSSYTKKGIKNKSSSYIILIFIYYYIINNKAIKNILYNDNILYEINKIFDLFKGETILFYSILLFFIDEIKNDEKLYEKYVSQLIKLAKRKNNKYFVLNNTFNFLKQKDLNIIQSIKLFYQLKGEKAYESYEYKF